MSRARFRFGDDPRPVIDALARGGVVLFPTESSYGVGADPRSRDGVETVYRLKERERGKPLGVVVADPEQAVELGVDAGDPAFRWARRRWPAALSVLVAVGARLPAMGDADLLSVRVPDHPELRRLLRAVGPMTATSANPAGGTPIVDPEEATAWAAEVDHVLVDGGVLPGGEPSTVVGWEISMAGDGGPRVLRPGRFSWT